MISITCITFQQRRFYILIPLGYYNNRSKETQFFACFFVAYIETHTIPGDFLFNCVHDAGLIIAEEGKGKKKSLKDKIAGFLANHDCGSVIDFIADCNRFVTNAHLSDLLGYPATASENAMNLVVQSQTVSTTPCR